MHIDDLKRWHWIVVSLVIGLLMAYVYSGSMAEGGPGMRRTMGRLEFLSRLGQTVADKNNRQIPILRNIKVYPPIENKNVVTLEELVMATDRATGARTGVYEPRQIITEIPFALQNLKAPHDKWTIADELGRRQQRGVKFQFRTMWMAATPYVYAICVGGSFLLVGVIWPTILQKLQSAGYGGAKREENAIDLSRVRSGSTKPTRPVAPTGPTAADIAQLEQVTAVYQQNVAGMSVAAADSKAGVAVASTEPARKWETAPVEQAKPAEKKDDDDEIEVKGEFYPVLIHHKKQQGDGKKT